MPKTIHTAGQIALCEAIASTRHAKGVTQAQLAQRLRCHQSLIARIESGERRIDVLEFIIIFRALEMCPFDALRSVSERIPEECGI